MERLLIMGNLATVIGDALGISDMKECNIAVNIAGDIEIGYFMYYGDKRGTKEFKRASVRPTYPLQMIELDWDGVRDDLSRCTAVEEK